MFVTRLNEEDLSNNERAGNKEAPRSKASGWRSSNCNGHLVSHRVEDLRCHGRSLLYGLRDPLRESL
jgi:hypothetical protein